MEHATQELGRIAVTHVGYLWLIPFFPALGAFINATIGWKLQQVFGKKIVHRIAVTMMWASFAVAVYAFKAMLALPVLSRDTVPATSLVKPLPSSPFRQWTVPRLTIALVLSALSAPKSPLPWKSIVIVPVLTNVPWLVTDLNPPPVP